MPVLAKVASPNRGCLNQTGPLPEMDIADLAICAADGATAAETATFLCRDIDETSATARELRIDLKEPKAPASC